jgi:hypothetical protein
MAVISSYKKKKGLGKESSYTKTDLEKIRVRAYYIWERKGKPDKETALDNWLQAEHELRSEGAIARY